MDRESHWNKVWSKYPENELSWFQEHPSLCQQLVRRHAARRDARIIDVGGGSSQLVDTLLADGFDNIGVLDIAAPALKIARERLGPRASSVEWIVGDVTTYEPSHPWDIWHDRAVFHFLIDRSEQEAYMRTLKRSLHRSGTVVIATFGLNGPRRCSGLEVQRHSPDTLSEVFGAGFTLIESQTEVHHTPGGADQQFIYCVFRRQQKDTE